MKKWRTKERIRKIYDLYNRTIKEVNDMKEFGKSIVNGVGRGLGKLLKIVGWILVIATGIAVINLLGFTALILK